MILSLTSKQKEDMGKEITGIDGSIKRLTELSNDSRQTNLNKALLSGRIKDLNIRKQTLELVQQIDQKNTKKKSKT